MPASKTSCTAARKDSAEVARQNRTGRKNPGRQATQRAPPATSPPPETTQLRMRVMHQRLAPGVEDGEEGDLGSEVSGVCGDRA